MRPQTVTRDAALFDTLLLLWLFNVLDTMFTVVGVSSGRTYEANPAMRWLLGVHPLAFVAVKLALMTAVCWGFWRGRRGHPHLATGLATAGACIYLLVCLWHVYVMWRTFG